MYIDDIDLWSLKEALKNYSTTMQDRDSDTDAMITAANKLYKEVYCLIYRQEVMDDEF